MVISTFNTHTGSFPFFLIPQTKPYVLYIQCKSAYLWVLTGNFFFGPGFYSFDQNRNVTMIKENKLYLHDKYHNVNGTK